MRAREIPSARARNRVSVESLGVVKSKLGTDDLAVGVRTHSRGPAGWLRNRRYGGGGTLAVIDASSASARRILSPTAADAAISCGVWDTAAETRSGVEVAKSAANLVLPVDSRRGSFHSRCFRGDGCRVYVVALHKFGVTRERLQNITVAATRGLPRRGIWCCHRRRRSDPEGDGTATDTRVVAISEREACSVAAIAESTANSPATPAADTVTTSTATSWMVRARSKFH